MEFLKANFFQKCIRLRSFLKKRLRKDAACREAMHALWDALAKKDYESATNLYCYLRTIRRKQVAKENKKKREAELSKMDEEAQEVAPAAEGPSLVMTLGEGSTLTANAGEAPQIIVQKGSCVVAVDAEEWEKLSLAACMVDQFLARNS
jgi:hypothetical protein